jgi:hypothetical protein
MTDSNAVLFYGDDRDGENPQDFLNKVERGFSGKTLLEKDKVHALKLWIKAGSEAKEWWNGLDPTTETDSWAHLVLAFEKRWPEKVATKKTTAEKQALLMAEVLKESEVGVRVQGDGVDELGHVRWANRVKALAKAIPDTNGLLVGAVRANLPAVLKEHIGGTFTDWDSFTDAVCKVSLADIADSKEKSQANERRLRRLETLVASAQQSPTAPLRHALSRTTISAPTFKGPGTGSPAAAPFNVNPFQGGAMHRSNLFANAGSYAPRPDTDRLADALRNTLPHHPTTPDGLSLYTAQVRAWAASNPNGKPNEHHPYPLTPGTVRVGSGECWKCGLVGHRGDQDPGTNLVPELEVTWRRIAQGIHNRARQMASIAPVNIVDTADPSLTAYLTSEEYVESIIADYLARQGNGEGSSA